jgi:hypothetical protein
MKADLEELSPVFENHYTNLAHELRRHARSYRFTAHFLVKISSYLQRRDDSSSLLAHMLVQARLPCFFAVGVQQGCRIQNHDAPTRTA